MIRSEWIVIIVFTCTAAVVSAYQPSGPQNQSAPPDAAEIAENLRLCLDGRYPNLCRRDLLTTEQAKQVDAARTKKAAPTARSASTGAAACFDTSIMSPTPFMGNNGEIFKLSNGSLWEVKYEYQYLYEYYPKVVVCPGRGKLLVKDKALNIQPVGSTDALKSLVAAAVGVESAAEVIESKIDGDFNGWEGETIFKLRNGQIWQQSSYAYKYSYKYSPAVLIYRSGSGYKLRVDGVDGEIAVNRLK